MDREKMSALRYEPMKNIGKVLIIRNQVYHRHRSADENTKDCKECKRKTRGDTAKEDAEVNTLVKQFQELGFKDIYGGTDGFVHTDKTKNEMIALLEEVAMQDLSGDYCFLCVILAYGKDNVIICLDESGNTDIKDPSPNIQLPLTELQNCLKGEKCTSLLAKPKIFMLQFDEVPRNITNAAVGSRPELAPIKIPREADFLTYTCENYPCENYPIEIIPAIDAWIKGFEDHVLEPQRNNKGPMEIQRLLTRMTNIYKSNYDNTHNITVDYPCVTSLLTKQVFLKKKA